VKLTLTPVKSRLELIEELKICNKIFTSMKTIDFSYFIERYNAGEMSDSEMNWFQKELEGNEKLRKETILRKKTDLILDNQDIISLRNKLSSIEKRRESKIPVENKSKRSPMKYAAVIAGIVVIGSIALFSGKNLTNEELIDQYYKAYEPITNQRSLLTESNNDLDLAMEYYNAHDFRNAAILFNKVVITNPKDMQSTLLNGISNFENKKYPDAKQSFGNVIDDNNNLYIDQAEWYLALCYLNTNELVKAKQLFEAIKKEDGVYKNDARKILRKMN
jgi:TolA-binding protein